MARAAVDLAAPVLVAVLAALGAPSPAAAQSLADVAAREALRRAAVTGAAPVFTNDDLVADTRAAVTAPMTPPTTEAGAGGTPEDDAAPGTEAPGNASQIIKRPDDRGEDYWRGRATRIRDRLARARADAEGLEAQLASHTLRLSAGEREALDRRAKKAGRDVQSLEEEQARFEAIARLADVPLSWIK